MRHFLRDARIVLSGEAGTETLEGYHFKFTVQKLYGGNGSTAKISIINLPERVRNRLARPRNMGAVPILVPPVDYVQLVAGYVGKSGVVHRGVVVQAINRRDGHTWTTELETSASYEQIQNTFDPFTFNDELVTTIIDRLLQQLQFTATAPYYVASSEAEAALAGKRQNLAGTRPWASLVQLLDDYGCVLSFTGDTPVITLEGKPLNESAEGVLYDVANGLKGSPTITPTGVEAVVQLDPGANVAQTFRVASPALTATLARSNPGAAQGVKYWASGVTHRGDTRGQQWDTVLTGKYIKLVEYGTLNALPPQPPQF